jgi:ABC-2 type transport system permease protein
MKKFLALLKISLNTNFGISALKYRYTKEKKKLWEPILIALSIIVGFGPLIAFYSIFANGLFYAGLTMGQPEIILTMAIIAAQIIVLIFGVFYVMSAFYFSTDISVLIPMPLGPYQVLGAKFAVITFNEYLTTFPILLPPIIIYGIGMKMGILYWIKGILVAMSIPVLPLVLSSILIVILMRFINIRKSKDLLAVIGGLFIIVLALAFNYFMQRLPQNIAGNEMEFFNNLMSSQYGQIKEIGRKFPPSIWATLGLAAPGVEGLGYFLLFIGVSILLFVTLLWIGNKMFYEGVLSGQEVNRKRKIMSAQEVEKRYKKSSNPVIAILSREWKMLFRTPVYVLNGLVGAFIGPVIIFLTFIGQDTSGEMAFLISMLKNPDVAIYVSLGGLAVMLFTSGMSVVASTSVSREGNTFWISKIIPVSPSYQALGKFLHAMIISVIGIVLTGIMMVIILDYPIAMMFLLIILGIIGSIPQIAVNLLIDIIHPKLVWNNPQEAIKQNFNAVIGMLASLLIMAVYAGAAYMMISFNLPAWVLLTVLGLAMAILSVPSMIILFSIANRKYASLEA